MSSAASRSVLYFRAYLSATMPFLSAVIDDLCASPDLPFELASTVEDIGQEFIRLSERINAELLKRGVLDHEADADKTTEARIDAVMEDLSDAILQGRVAARKRVAAVLEDESVQQALRTALLMTHDLPRAPARDPVA